MVSQIGKLRRDPPVDTSGAGARSDDRVCVVVPTRNEADDVAELVERIARSEPTAEILFVDDSDDRTPAEIRRVAAATASVPVWMLHRPPGRRDGGLGGAVLAGATAARADWIVVIDGDLQHPPEVIPELLRKAREGAAVVVASRHVVGGSSRGLASPARVVGAAGAAGVARMLFPRALRGVSDPLSGCFVVRRTVLTDAGLRPRGFKLLLEVLVRVAGVRVAEVPMEFDPRRHGRTKAGYREALRFLVLLVVLRVTAPGWFRRMLALGLVGLSGLLINLTVLRLAQLWAGPGRSGLLAESAWATIATQAAVVWNFLLTEVWVYRARWGVAGVCRRFVGFWLIGMTTLAVQVPLTVGVRAVVPVDYVVATGIVLCVLAVFRFVLLDELVYRAARRRGPRKGTGAG